MIGHFLGKLLVLLVTAVGVSIPPASHDAIAVVGKSTALRQPPGLPQDSLGQRAERHATLPVATGDGKRVLFTSERDNGLPQLYSINLDGTDERRLTNLTTFDMAPDSSRAGKWISFLFLASANSPAQIGLMRADGSGRRDVPRTKDVRWPRISPDGKRIVFTAANEQGESTIFIVNVDGTALKPFPSGLKQSWDPAWSPDGRRLAFSAYPSDFKHLDTMVSTIYVADVSGGKRRLLANVPGLLQLGRWSPDGKHLAYQTYTGGPDANIVLIDVSSGKVTTITHHQHPYLDEAPSWLRDGRLLFQSTRTGKFEVWIMNADGSGARQVTGVK